MEKLKSTFFVLMTVIFIAIVQVNTVYSQSEAAQNSGNSVFAYKYPSGDAVHYLTNQKIVQMMDVEGQQVQVIVTSVNGCFVKSSGNQGNNLKLEFRVDTMSQVVDSPQGVTGGNIPDAKGKTFHMIISPKGKQVDISEAASITVMKGENGSTNLSQSFTGFFPILPQAQVKPGSTWPSTDTIKFNSESISMNQVVKSQNTFERFENVQGINCARISSVMQGTWLMKTQSQGFEMSLNGTFTGTGTVYFAPAEGYFVRNDATMKVTGTLEIVSPQSMTMPIVMDITSSSGIQK
ncbi:MAG: hypothetical protein ACM3NR_01445 [Methanosarcina sp.]